MSVKGMGFPDFAWIFAKSTNSRDDSCAGNGFDAYYRDIRVEFVLYLYMLRNFNSTCFWLCTDWFLRKVAL